jgi:hypothetical protein
MTEHYPCRTFRGPALLLQHRRTTMTNRLLMTVRARPAPAFKDHNLPNALTLERFQS